MFNEKEYIKNKREYIKTANLNNDTVYTYLNEKQISIIRKYYEVYTKYLFNKLMGSLRLEVSSEKMEKLVKLKGVGTWEFAGMVDMFKRGAAFCELGHPLRYVYSAINTSNKEKLFFGSRCVGDFFDLDEEGVNALTKVKDEMFNELKDIVAIKEMRMIKEHHYYDCKELGLIFNTVGLKGVESLVKLNPLMPIVIDFFANNLPLPKSLLTEMLRFKSDFEMKLEDLDFLGIDSGRLELLKKSEITTISHMFSFSEQEVLSNIKKGTVAQAKSDFFNFGTVSDINTGICVWENRNDRLLKAQNYFNKMGICGDWSRVYRYMIENGYKRDVLMLYYGVEILMLFSKNVVIEHSFYNPKEYNYKGYKLNKNSYDTFDSIIDYMATREFIMTLKEINQVLIEEDNKESTRQKEVEVMMGYLRENLQKDAYERIRGINGVIDIVMNKKLEFENMTEKQQKYVENTYNTMVEQDNKVVATKPESVVDTEVNNRYKLIEKPDMLAKIQRLQSEAESVLPDFIKGILQSVMTYKYVSDRQIKHINDAYAEHILGETPNVTTAPIKASIGPQKWNLIERSDIKDKILDLQRHPEYYNMHPTVRDIFTNILKYNSVSERQIESVERTYKRYFGSR